MKLHNKKTGEITDISKNGFLKSDNDGHIIVYQEGTLKYYAYNSLAELNEEWEDYKPAEPLIKDGDARNAVYSWASSLGIHEVRCKKTARGLEVITFEAFRLMTAPRIEFACYNIDANVTDGKDYTIAELCGEEEE